MANYKNYIVSSITYKLVNVIYYIKYKWYNLWNLLKSKKNIYIYIYIHIYFYQFNVFIISFFRTQTLKIIIRTLLFVFSFIIQSVYFL
jgi:hypothetical protein